MIIYSIKGTKIGKGIRQNKNGLLLKGDKEQIKKSLLRYVKKDPYLKNIKKIVDEDIYSQVENGEDGWEYQITYGLFTIDRWYSYSLMTSEEAKWHWFETFIRSYEGKTSWWKVRMERINNIRRAFDKQDLEIKND